MWPHNFFLPYRHLPSFSHPPTASLFSFFKRNTCSGLRAHVTLCASHGTETRSSAMAATTEPNITNKSSALPVERNTKWRACHCLFVFVLAGMPALANNGSCQTTEILAKRISVSLTDRSSPDLTYCSFHYLKLKLTT